MIVGLHRGCARWLSLCLTVWGCGAGIAPAVSSSASDGPATTRSIDYAFRLAPDLRTLEARVCFEGQVPLDLVGGERSAHEALQRAFVITEDGTRDLVIRDGRVDLSTLTRGQCVGYEVHLEAWGGPVRANAVGAGGALVTNTAAWLWRPRSWQTVGSATASIVVPSGMRVSVPWPTRGQKYTLDKGAFAFYGMAVFGHFDVKTVQAPGAQINVAILDGLSSNTREAVVPWLSAAANMVALPMGRFPGARAQVVVVPVEGSGAEPLRFGMMFRGGGPSAIMLLRKDAQPSSMLGDWVAVHEFSHLLAPFVTNESAWLSEGLATYYQEVLRVRAGLLPAAEVWQRFYRGALHGRTATRSLAEESADVFQTHQFQMVYWAGAAIALMADVELRRRSRGTRSLDDVMGALHACCAQASRQYTAAEVVARMDRIAGTPIFSALVERWVKGPLLPDLEALYADLGVEVIDGRVRLDAAAKDAWIADAITRVQSLSGRVQRPARPSP